MFGLSVFAPVNVGLCKPVLDYAVELANAAVLLSNCSHNALRSAVLHRCSQTSVCFQACGGAGQRPGGHVEEQGATTHHFAAEICAPRVSSRLAVLFSVLVEVQTQP